MRGCSDSLRLCSPPRSRHPGEGRDKAKQCAIQNKPCPGLRRGDGGFSFGQVQKP